MLIKCSSCGEKDSMKIDSNKLICKKCNFVYRNNFEEVNGALISSHPIEIEIDKKSNLILSKVSEGEENLQILVNMVFPESPYDGSKNISKYRVVGTFKIEAFYE
jgi:hypothetical protein